MTVLFELATIADVPAMGRLLADDELGAAREGTDPAPYRRAFEEIHGDPAHELVVGRRDGRFVSVLQLSLLPCMTHGGARRAKLEGVSVARDVRGEGVGEAMVHHDVERARARGCTVVQLTPTGAGTTPTGSTSGSASAPPTTA